VNNRDPGLLHSYTTNQLGGMAIRATLEAGGIAPERLGHVIMGNALESHRDSIYGARGMALEGGVPWDVPALTVRRICGSGTQAIVNAVQMLLLGDMPDDRPFLLAGGAESMQYPHVLYNLRGRKVGNTVVKYGPLDCSGLPRGSWAQDLLYMALYDPSAGMAMANTAELLGRQYGITREEADRFALRSHQRALAWRNTPGTGGEIIPVPLPGRGEARNLAYDTHVRPGISLDGLAELPVVFEPPAGIITPGNASAVVDGAAALVLCREEDCGSARPLVRIRGWGLAGVDPRIMGIGPVPATRLALEMAGITGADLDTVELNEAFAPQSLACIRDFAEMGIDPEKVNPVGGAIALGHPLGATGSILTITAANYLKHSNGRYGLITLCIGGGQGIALVIENLQRH
jgi:acetyl-CoA acetyltransferase family protein